MKKIILGRRNNIYKKEYEEYLEKKKGTPYKYQRFYELRQDYNFSQVLEMKYRKEGTYLNGRKGFKKYSKEYIKMIRGAFECGSRLKEIAENFNITPKRVEYIIYNLKYIEQKNL